MSIQSPHVSSETAIIRPAPLREQAQAIIREAIVSGEIGPESIYSATALAKQLGISVSPVREAMMALVNEGVLEPVRNRGFRLVPRTEEELDELADIRRLLEVPAIIRLAAVDVADLRAPAEAEMAEARRAAEDGRIRDFLIHERRVHELFLIRGGGERLAKLALGLRDQERLGAVAELPPEALVGMVDELERVLAAAEAGDTDLVRAEISSHLDHVRADLAETRREPEGARLEPLIEPLGET
ncbi:MAG TPA: GntR family transcriptional regulator [Segeticoccus sp.]|uniref:GntR family transcriptional regulator n=1 Tax=Segeticoccus sp. TaxID=2706531 RepID=UPI002D7E2F8F|nr:GntR family transcriptional regulator [Segeticoccus sp.]HET8601754.1 GntR family transcriptional regulator [Segeticoccus sp.]